MAKKMLNEGDILRIELIDGRKIQAEFLREMNDDIFVKNCKDLATQKIRNFNQTFYGPEITAIHTLCAAAVVAESENANDSSNNNNIINGSDERLHSQNGGGNRDGKKSFSIGEIENIQNMVGTTVHIAQHNDDYYRAINDLKKQDIITVTSENHFGRLDVKRPLMTIATPSKVFMFDMLRLGSMRKEFKEIFSSELPRKIIHSTAEFADYLRHKENCALNGAFDTLMVHFSLKKTRTPIRIQECFTTYLSLPDDFILQKFNYHIRPLAKDAMICAAFNAIFLMKLYWHMNDILMKPLHIATAQFANTFQDVPNQVDVMVYMNEGKYPGVEGIDVNAVEILETEFEKLLQTE